MRRLRTTPLLLTILLVVALAATARLMPNASRLLAQGEPVWCFDEVTGADGSRQTFGHPPSSASASAVAQSAGGVAVERRCFDTWAGAAAYITDGKVLLPDDATEEDYVRETGRLAAPAPNSGLRDLLQALLDQEVAARNVADWEALRALIHPAAGARWLRQQRNLLDPTLTDIYPTRIETSGEWALAAVIETHQGEESPPTQMYTTRAFRQSGAGDWLLTSPDLAAWGEPQQLRHHSLQIDYYTFDEPYIRAIVPRLPLIAAQIAADFGLPAPADDLLRVQVTPFPANAISDHGALTITVPSPLSPGFPLGNAQSPEEFLLGYLSDVYGHALLTKAYGEKAAEAGRLALAHTAIQWEVEQAVGRDATARLAAQMAGEPLPLAELLDPAKADATGNRPAEQHLFLRFAVDTYGRAILAPYLHAVFESANADEIAASAFDAELEVLEAQWQKWLAAPVAAHET